MALVKESVGAAKEESIEIHVKTRVKESFVDKGNGIVGVLAEDKEGNPFKVKRKGVVLTTGDLASDAEMVEKYTRHGRNAPTIGNPGRTGDGIRMAWAAGVAPEGS